MVRAAVGSIQSGGTTRTLRMGTRRLRSAGTLLAVSSLYEDARVGGPDQDPYLKRGGDDRDHLSAQLISLLHEDRGAGGPDPPGALGAANSGPRLVVYDEIAVDSTDLELPHRGPTSEGSSSLRSSRYGPMPASASAPPGPHSRTWVGRTSFAGIEWGEGVPASSMRRPLGGRQALLLAVWAVTSSQPHVSTPAGDVGRC